MFRLLYKYLILNKKASVPGIGVFYIESTPARLDFANKVFIAPTSHINFTPHPSAGDDRMTNFISIEKKVDESEATGLFNDFAKKLKESIKANQAVELPGLGVLSQNTEGELYFKETHVLNNYYPPAAAERVLRDNTEHHIQVGDNSRTNTQMKERLVDEPENASNAKDYWWIFAIALGVISIAAIVYYYLHNGSLK